MVKRYTRRVLKILAIVFLGMLALYAVMAIYLHLNKQKIIDKVKAEIEKKVNGNVSIGNVDLNLFRHFPNSSAELQDVLITDSLYKVHRRPFLIAKSVFLEINLWKALFGNSPITSLSFENGKVNFFTDSTGYTNQYIFRSKDGENKRGERKKGNVITKLHLINMRLVKDDRVKHKLYDLEVKKMDCDIESSDTLLSFNAQNQLVIRSFILNEQKGSFAKDAPLEGYFKIVYRKIPNILTFKNIEVELHGHPFIFSGNFHLADSKLFSLQVTTRAVKYDLAKSLLPIKMQEAVSIVDVEKTIDVGANIDGFLTPGDPLATVHWIAREPTHVSTPFAEIDNAVFSGSYTNQIEPGKERKDPNSMVQFHNFSGTWEGIPIESKNIYIFNLARPFLVADFSSQFYVSQLNDVLRSRSFSLNKGKGKLNILYKGSLAKDGAHNTNIEGIFSLQQAEIQYHPRGVLMQDCSGDLLFKGKDIWVQDLSCKVQNTSLVINGKANQVLALVDKDGSKMSLDWDIYSPAVKLENFTGLLKQRKEVAARDYKKSSLKEVARMVDNTFEKSNIRMQFNTKSISYKRFNANDVNADLALAEDNWALNNVSLMHGDGSIKLKGSLKGINPRYSSADLQVNMDKVDVKKLMYDFNNFGQNGIESGNLLGTLQTDMKVQMQIDRELQTDPTEMNGFIDFSLKKGALLNFEPLQKMHVFLFKNRNFEQVHFAELKDRLELKGREIKINRMAISSTALNVFVEGVYDLDGEDTDIRVQVPLRNMRKPKSGAPKSVTNDARGGMSVFLRGKPGDDGKIEFKLDVLGKLRKIF